MEHSLIRSPIRFLLLAAVVVAGCEGERTSPSKDGESWTAPLPPVRTLPTAPVVDGISPALASPAMTVRISGSGFGSEVSAVSVSFGGVPAVPVSVSDDEIRVHPVAGGTIAEDGSVDVIVSVGGMPSNAMVMRLGAKGDVEVIETAPPETVGAVLALADGSTVVTDPIGGRLHHIAADGVVRAVADPQGLLQTPGAAVLAPDGAVLVFDPAALAIWRYEPAGGQLSAWREQTPGWTDGAWLGTRLYALAGSATTVDRIEESGTVSATLSLTECSGATSIAALDGLLYVTVDSSLCRIDPATGSQAEIALSGETAWLIDSLEAGDGALLATGIFTPGPAVARIETDGTVSITATPAGYVEAAAHSTAGLVVGLSDGNVMRENRLLATRVRDLGDFREADGRYLVTGGSAVPFLAELWADGSYRVLATGEIPAMWTHVEPDGDGFLIAVYDWGQVMRVAADGSLSVVIDHSAIGPVPSFVRTAEGEFLLTSYGPDIARYAADGTLLDAAYVHSEGAYAFGLVLVDQTVYAAAGDRLLEADALEGGAAISRTSPMNGLLGIAADGEGRIYVSDGNDTGDIFRLEGDALVKVGHAGTATALSVSADGEILIANLSDLPTRMLP